jgi:ribosomal protein S18 acetylase RimI-like enzyme
METYLRGVLRHPSLTINPYFLSIVTGVAHGFGNFAFISDATDIESVEIAVQPLIDSGTLSSFLFSESPSEEVVSALTARGYQLAGNLPAMAIDLNVIAATELPKGYEFRRLLTQEGIEPWVQALETGFGLPRPVANLFSPEFIGIDPSEHAACQFFAIYKGDRPVAISLLYIADGIAGIYCIATLPDERGKGLGAHVTAETLRVAKGLGYAVGILQSSSPAAHSLYERIGFRDVGHISFFLRNPS